MTTRTRRHWTHQEEMRLRSLYLGYRTKRQIAAALGRTTESVRSKIHALWLRRKPRSAAWRELFAAGVSVAEAAGLMGASVGVAYAARRRLRRAGCDVQEERVTR